MHTGEQYHQILMSSKRDLAVRGRFEQIALDLLAKGGDILDFGAGTGIDAKAYVAGGRRTFMYGPAESMHEHLERYCHDGVSAGTVIRSGPELGCRVQAVTANFAALNHFADHTELFAQLSGIVSLDICRFDLRFFIARFIGMDFELILHISDETWPQKLAIDDSIKIGSSKAGD